MDGIRLEGVSAHFRHQVKGDIAAVRDVSLDVAPGELMTLLGPSGCGKTTTLRMIAGFQEPSAGEIWIGERNVTGIEANRRNIGFVFQNYALFPHLSVFENVAYGLKVQRMDGAAVRSAVTEVLALVGLASYEKQMPHQLSGGEQQRVALARAIVIKPRVLLFDEPLSNLDAKLRTQMRAEIREPAAAPRHHGGLRDARPGRGDGDLGPHRRDEQGRDRAGRHAPRSSIARPASVFVARFIGRSNLVDATVTAAGAGRVALTIAGRPHDIVGADPRFPAGSAVLANVRPEAIAIGPPGDGIAGTVRTRTYLGEKTEYEVEVAGRMLQVVRFNPPPAERFGPDDAVSLRLPHEGVQLLAREEP